MVPPIYIYIYIYTYLSFSLSGEVALLPSLLVGSFWPSARVRATFKA